MDGYPTLAVLNRLFDAIVDDDKVSTLTTLTIPYSLSKNTRIA